MKTGCLLLVLVFVALAVAAALIGGQSAGNPEAQLAAYGRHVAASAQPGALTFVGVVPTVPRVFKLTFRTGHRAPMTDPNASAKGDAALLTNLGKTKIWSLTFCTPELKQLMRAQGLSMVVGDLTNLAGETQSTSICTLD